MAEIEETIRKFVLEELAAPKGVAEVEDDESLIEGGVIDSLGIFQLVAFLEESLRIRIRDEDIVPENFRTLATIQRFVREQHGS